MRKSVLITGSTDGIGKGTAIKLAEDGWKVLIHGRSQERVDKTVWEIRNRLGNVDVVGYHGDFSSLKEVERMAEKIMSTEGRLNALLNNAGTLMKSFKLSEDGFEMSFAVNHLAHFYLSGRLLPLLLNTVNARIINVSSGIHSGKIDLNRFMLAENFEPVNSYSVSKLCNILFSYKLAAILKGMPITVNCMHPGVINTKMLKETWGAIGSGLVEGVEREIYLVSSKELENVSGKYIDNFKATRSTSISYDTDLQIGLWELSRALISNSGLQNPYL